MDLVVSLPLNYTYSLPLGFSGTTIDPKTGNASNVNTFVANTTTGVAAIDDALARASSAPFISFSDAFSELIGATPNITLIDERPGDLFAFETGPWVPRTNQFWFTSSIYQVPRQLEILDLETGHTFTPQIPDDWTNFQRGVYSATDDRVYFTSHRDNDSFRGGLISMDPEDYSFDVLFNSYAGLPFAGLNEVFIAQAPRGDRFLFVSDIDTFVDLAYDPIAPPEVYTALYRWDMQEHVLLPMLSRTPYDLFNGAKLGPDLRTMYATDSGSTTAAVIPTQKVWKFDLDEDSRPINPRLFAVPRYFVDGIQIDDQGWVWTVEGDGIVVRDSDGILLGIFNRQYFGNSGVQMANFGLAGDQVVVLGGDRLWTVRLTRPVLTPSSTHYFA